MNYPIFILSREIPEINLNPIKKPDEIIESIKSTNEIIENHDHEKIYKKKYYQSFKEKHNMDSTICNICDGKYNYYSKSAHLKSKKHVMMSNK